MNWPFSKNLVYGELVFKLFSEEILEPLQGVRGRQMAGPAGLVPLFQKTSLSCVLGIVFVCLFVSNVEKSF